MYKAHIRNKIVGNKTQPHLQNNRKLIKLKILTFIVTMSTM